MSCHPDPAEHRRRCLDALHRLHHEYGLCRCDRPPAPPDERAEFLERGHRAAAESRDRGVDLGQLTDDELIELGRSARAADAVAALELVKERNRVVHEILTANQRRTP